MFIIDGIMDASVTKSISFILFMIMAVLAVGIFTMSNTFKPRTIGVMAIVALICGITCLTITEKYADRVELESKEFVRYFISETILLENTNVGDNEILVMIYNEKVRDLNKALEYAKDSYGEYTSADPSLFDLKPLELIEVI